jgi:hypothetical protein
LVLLLFWRKTRCFGKGRMRETGRGGGGGGMPGDYSSYRGISKKWVGLVTAIWVQAISGNNYTFANYSAALKTVMQYNQQQLNSLGVAKDVGKSFGLLAGLLADYLPTWAILLIGAIEGFLGYGAQYLVVSQKISPLPFWQVRCWACFSLWVGLSLVFLLLSIFLEKLFFMVSHCFFFCCRWLWLFASGAIAPHG